MGFLSGNTNLVRVPSQKFHQIDIIVKVLDEVLDSEEFSHLRQFGTFFTSERDDPAMLELVRKVSGLVGWGGDQTVKTFRLMEKHISAVELYFPDRVSCAVLSAKEVAALESKMLDALSDRFFNDTFLVDQNACSSPGMVFWIGNDDDRKIAQDKFWGHVGSRITNRYHLDPMLMMEKHLDVINMVKDLGRPISSLERDKILWRFDDPNLGHCKLRFGNFLEINIDRLDEIGPFLRPNEQTITQFGLNSQDIFERLAAFGHIVDRIVPVGDALSIGMDWDGKQSLSLLSRQVEIR